MDHSDQIGWLAEQLNSALNKLEELDKRLILLEQDFAFIEEDVRDLKYGG